MRKTVDRKKVDHEELGKMFKRHGYTDFKWITPKGIVIS